MKLHRRDALKTLALFGWALIFPPMLGDQAAIAAPVNSWALIFPPLVGDRVDIGAPVNEWDVMGKGFATVKECEEYREHFLMYVNLTNRNPRVEALVRALPQRLAAARCVPADDPRLKGENRP